MDQQEWTIMIYMAGDNNLSVDMAYAMQQIKEVAGEDTENVNLFVYYDGYSASIPTLYCDFSDSNNPKHIRSYMVKNKLFPVESKHDENAADYRSVLNFVDWCVNKVVYSEDGTVKHGRRAHRYALIFSGHSMGFQDIGLYRDETSGKALDMEKLHWLLERITKSKEELIAEAGDSKDGDFERRTTEILGQKLDILGFDSCVMSMLEVGYQFNAVAKSMIASEGSVPNAGWTYAKILGSLAHHSKNLPVGEVTANFVSEFIRSQDSYTIGGISVDMAAWDLSQLSNLNEEFEKLSDALIECFADKDSTIYRQMERVLLQVHWKCQSYMYDQNVDLGDFCELLRQECGSLREEVGKEIEPFVDKIERGCQGVLSELRNAVILSGFSGGGYQYSNGISLFFPWSFAAYDISLENYSSLKFVSETGAGKKWNQFLDAYLRQVTYRQAPGPTETGTEPSPIILEMKVPGKTETEPDVVAYESADSRLRYYSYEYKDYSTDLRFESEDTKLPGEAGTKLPAEAGTKLPGEAGTKLPAEAGTKLPGEAGTKLPGEAGTKLPGEAGTKLPGEAGTKLPAEAGTKLPAEAGTKLPGEAGTKLPAEAGTKLPGEAGTKLPGEAGTKLPAEAGTKLPGEAGTKLPGEAGTKLPAEAGTKLPGEAGTKLPGEAGTKLPGEAGTKLAGGGGSSSFFATFKYFKNMETPWNISGFTKGPNQVVQELKAKKKSGSSG